MNEIGHKKETKRKYRPGEREGRKGLASWRKKWGSKKNVGKCAN